jgi:hypothetical protein
MALVHLHVSSVRLLPDEPLPALAAVSAAAASRSPVATVLQKMSAADVLHQTCKLVKVRIAIGASKLFLGHSALSSIDQFHNFGRLGL